MREVSMAINQFTYWNLDNQLNFDSITSVDIEIGASLKSITNIMSSLSQVNSLNTQENFEKLVTLASNSPMIHISSICQLFSYISGISQNDFDLLICNHEHAENIYKELHALVFSEKVGEQKFVRRENFITIIENEITASQALSFGTSQ